MRSRMNKIERKPGQVEQGSRRAARKKRADGIEIADRLHAVVTAPMSTGIRTIAS